MADNKKWLRAQAEKVRAVDYIDPALYRKYGVKRGLRDDNGIGVLVGLTTIGNVHGYVMDEGERRAVPGELYYRGINVSATRRRPTCCFSASCPLRANWSTGRTASAPTASSPTASRRTRS